MSVHMEGMCGNVRRPYYSMVRYTRIRYRCKCHDIAFLHMTPKQFVIDLAT
jgi:hypothetical protein